VNAPATLPPSPRLRLRVLHDELDRKMARRSVLAVREGNTIACRRGCAACCYEATDVTEAEAAALLDRIEDTQGGYGIDMLVERCETQLRDAGPAAGDGKAWLAKRLRCVFLDEQNECSVYDLRPHSCRALVVVNTAEHCGQVGATFTQVDARTPIVRFISQALPLGRISPPVDLLPRMLLRLARRRGAEPRIYKAGGS
jgi:Fe-S-cluster containining protein